MRKLTLKNLLARKVRLVMSTLSIVLGVGFLTGVLTFSTGLQSTFDGIIEGSTSDGLVRPTGMESFSEQGASSSITLSPADVAKVAALPEVARADGNVEGFGLFLLDPDKKLVGGNGPPTISFNHHDAPNLEGEPTMLLEEGAWPSKPGEVAIDAGAAERAGYEIGDTVNYIPPFAETPLATAKLVGTANFNGGGTAGATLVIFDTEGAQQLFLGGKDAFTSIALTAAEGVSQKELTDAVDEVLPKAFTAVTGDQVIEESKDAVGQFLGIITQFLIVFALIAIVVGAFIIANTFNILVAQRVRELALLRALGASRKQVTRSVLLEALVMSVFAATIGIALGLGLARGLAAIFRSVGLDIAGEALTLTPTTIATAYLVGVLVTVVSAWIPARRAAKVAPVAAMREEEASVDEGSLRRRGLVAGAVALLALGAAVWGLIGAPGNDTAWVGGAAVVWILTLAAVSPIVGRPVLQAARAVFARLFGSTGKLAGENALRNPRRTGATASALMIGLALVSAIGVLAASMNASADKMVDDQFSADFLVQGATYQAFPTAVGDAIERTDGVATVSRQQWLMATIDGDQQTISGVSKTFPEVYDVTMADGELSLRDGSVLLSEDKARDFGLSVGDELTVPLPGNKSFTNEVAGIFESNAVTAGIVVPLSSLEAAGVDRRDNDLSILAEEGADLEAVKADLDQVVKDLPIITVYDKVSFGDTIRGQINQLLYMIYGLLALAIIIAIIGIVNTLGLSVIERTREIGLLRAIGLSRARLRRMITLESVAIALLGAVLGMALGLVIGVLVQRTLAENLEVLALPMGQLGIFLVLAVIVGVLAAIIPAVRASRMKVLDAIATE